MAQKVVRFGVTKVKPVLSGSPSEARRRVINLYKLWYRAIPEILVDYRIDVTEQQIKDKLRENFMKHKNMTDLRAIDLMVVKGQLELMEVANVWQQNTHVMRYFKPSENPKPQGFLSEFYAGQTTIN